MWAAGGGLDADASDWATRVAANSGTVSGGTLRAVSRFAKACKAAGIWTKLTRVNLFCGNQLAACLVPLKVGGGNATDTNTNFVSGDYTEATGLTGNGTNKRLATGQTIATHTDASLGVYCRTASAVANVVEMGGWVTAGTTHSSIRCRGFSPENAWQAGNAGIGTSGLSSAGFHVGASVGTTGGYYRNGVLQGSTATVGSAAGGTRPLFVFAENDGTGANFSARALAGYFIGGSLADTEVASLYTAMQAFQAALNRSV